MDQVKKELFKKITEINEFNYVISSIPKKKPVLVCKAQSNFVTQVICESLDPEMNFICKPLSGEKPPTSSLEIVTCNFILDTENYFFQSELVKENYQVILKSPKDLFCLQRRQNFRVKLPDTYQGFLEIKTVAEKGTSLKLKIRDISVSGCRTEFHSNSPTLKIGDFVEGVIALGSRDPFEIKAIVRNLKTRDKGYSVGLEFVEKNNILERLLFSLTLDLYRELYFLVKAI